MKKPVFLLLAVVLHFCANAQDSKFDTIAITILDRMTDIIGDLSSCTFTVNNSIDHVDAEKGLVTSFGNNELYFSGPDKFLVNLNGDKGHQGYWYNAGQLNFYSYDENNYATINTPLTSVETIDTVNKIYGIEFPAADFFYPTFTDDLIQNSDEVSYLGTTDIDGKSCFHILAKNKDVNIQVWITNDGMTLPKKLLINYLNDKETLRFESNFSNWKLNPVLPDAMFQFLPPPRANQVYLMPAKQSN